MNSVCADNPLISVVMPVYNAEPYLHEAIESILAQSYSNFEFIIVDDCSIDASVSIIRKYSRQDVRIRALYLPHQGAGAAANAGIAAAKGAYIARMDADDIALPERFATQLAWMQHTEADICGSCIKTFGAESRLMWFPETHEAIRVEMLFRCALMQPTVMLRADIARKHPYTESLYFEDYELWTRLAPKYRMGNVPQVLLKYRTHHSQRHIVNAIAVRNELRTYCKTYYRTLFPDATNADERLVADIVCMESLKSLTELTKAGELLTGLAEVNDQFLRKRMAERWMATCRRSAILGLGAYKVYQDKAAGFGGAPVTPATIWLAFACLFRLGYGSDMEKILKKLFKYMRFS